MTSSAETPAPSRGSLLVLFLVVFIDLLGFGMVLPLLPNYAKQFGAPFGENFQGLLLGLLMSSFSIMQFFFAPLWGRLSDRIGRRPVLMIGLAGSVVSYLLFAWATVQESLQWLFISRIGAGIAGATISTAQAYIADSTALAGRAKGMALIGAAFGLGFTFGPLFGYLAVESETDVPGPGPGYAAAALSAGALLLACFVLRESLSPEKRGAAREGGWWDGSAWRAALSVRSLPILLLATFICVFAFANFEATLSLLLKGTDERIAGRAGFGFTYGQVLLAFSYIGFSLLLAQGFLVRRLAGKVPETTMVLLGCLLQVAGFGVLLYAIQQSDRTMLFVALTLIVVGFSCVNPSLNSLISRRADPTAQGKILGVSQSVNSLARICGPIVGSTLLFRDPRLPYITAAVVMLIGCGLVQWGARSGADFQTKS